MGIVKTLEEVINPSEGEIEPTTEWVDEEGTVCDTVEDALNEIQRNGYVDGDALRWFSTVDAEINYRDGTHTSYSYFLSGFSEAELDAINDGIKR